MPGLKFGIEGLDLSFMQFKYIVDRKQALQPQCDIILEKVLSTLACVINKIYPEKESISFLKNIIEGLKKNNSIFEYIP